MAPILEPKFCSRCGAAMAKSVPPGDKKPRSVCAACGFVHYLDPKVACGCVVETESGLALIRRAIEPQKGFWSFPCGFMEVDETTEAAAVRETLEETGLQVALEGHLGTYSYPDSFYGGSVVVVVYAARATGGTPRADDDVDEVKLVSPSEIPWERLAFRSSVAALRDWLRRKGLSAPPLPG